jgi:hypothetical protein
MPSIKNRAKQRLQEGGLSLGMSSCAGSRLLTSISRCSRSNAIGPFPAVFRILSPYRA